MVEHHITVQRTARYCTLGEGGSPTREVWVVCHGFGQLAPRFIRWFEPLASRSRLIVAPEALNRFYLESPAGGHGPESRVGATWMTREDRLNEIADYVRYLDTLHDEIFFRLDRARVRLIVLGFSQGTATVGRWLTQGRSRADRMILWGGDLPEDMDLASAAPVLNAQSPVMVVGDGEPAPYLERLDASRKRAAASGVEIGLITYSGDHRITGDALQLVAGTGRTAR